MDTQTDCLSYFLNNKLNIMIEHLGVSLRAAAGRAGVNQARFAVLTMRLSSLTRPAVAGLFQASASSRQLRIPTHAFLLHFRFATMKKVDPAPLIPTCGRR